MTQEELMVEARLAIPTTFVVIYDSLIGLLKAHENHVKNKENLIHVTCLNHKQYRARYERNPLEINRLVKEVYKKFLLNPPSIKP
ncbi:hypothetical protein [Vibrio cyclitrophicus]|uniref:hypothetical protein n=1 Tax=Vibrio cyclitrophicus TaxID=47951 RepID=UPI00036CB88F|nr:hypothetical protein [Vibrio cyclitrophicus]OEF27345.1 hypothetical protein OA9_14365 [Vibrio cyclitrophicus 1F97]